MLDMKTQRRSPPPHARAAASTCSGVVALPPVVGEVEDGPEGVAAQDRSTARRSPRSAWRFFTAGPRSCSLLAVQDRDLVAALDAWPSARPSSRASARWAAL